MGEEGGAGAKGSSHNRRAGARSVFTARIGYCCTMAAPQDAAPWLHRRPEEGVHTEVQNGAHTPPRGKSRTSPTAIMAREQARSCSESIAAVCVELFYRAHRVPPHPFLRKGVHSEVQNGAHTPSRGKTRTSPTAILTREQAQFCSESIAAVCVELFYRAHRVPPQPFLRKGVHTEVQNGAHTPSRGKTRTSPTAILTREQAQLCSESIAAVCVELFYRAHRLSWSHGLP